MPDFPRSKLSSPNAPAPDIEDRRIWASVRAQMFGDEAVTTIDRFELRERLGAGAQGIVYRAFDPKLHREVALKYVHLRARADTNDGDRLLDEARAVARVQHPNLLAVHDAGEFQDGVWIAMELVEGTTLRRYLAQSRAEPRTLAQIFIALADGLQHAHERGLSHGDFKPDNVLLDVAPDVPRPRIVDFGLAHPRTHAVLDAPPSTGSSTDSTQRSTTRSDEHTIHLRGTPAYMAPELFAGARPDERSDQYAFCVTLYEALYGERPFSGPTRTTLARRVLAGERTEPPQRDAPAWLASVVERGLQANPEHRYASMRELQDALRRGVRQDDAPANRRWVPAVVGALTIGVGGLLVAQLRSAAPPPPTEDRCANVGIRADLLWDTDRRARVSEHFAEVQTAYREEALAKVDRALGEWQRAWKASRIELCADRLDQPELRAFRQRCLEDQAARVDGFVSALEASPGDGPSLAGAVNGATKLPTPSNCHPSPALERRFAAEQARARRGEPFAPEVAAELRAELASLRGSSDVMVTDALLQDATDFAAKVAERSTDAPSQLLLRARLLVAQLTARRGKHADALALAQDSFHAAVAQQHEQEAAELALLALWVATELTRDLATAKTWESLAAAHVAALDKPPALHAAQLEYAGVAAIVDGRSQDAITLLQEVLEIRTSTPALRDTAYRTYNNLASAYRRAGDLEKALNTTRTARAEVERVLGTLHPQTGAVYSNHGTFAINLGRYEEADGSLTKALTIKRQTLGSQHPAVGSTLVNIAHLREMQKRYDEAIAAYAEAKALYITALGPDHLRLGTLLFNEGILFTTLERYADAQANFEAFTRIQRVHHPEHHADVLVGRLNVADLRTRQGHAQDALRELEAIESVEPSTPLHPLDRANLHGALARANAALQRTDAFTKHHTEHKRICTEEYTGVDCLDASLELLH